jgi:hypothetical protein
MGNGLLTSMAITDAYHIASLKSQSQDDDAYIARLQKEKRQILEDCAANLLEKLALRQALAHRWDDHPLLKKANAEIIHRTAARIISTPGATFDDVRSQEPAIRANDYKVLTGGGSLPDKGVRLVGEDYIKRKDLLENFVKGLPLAIRRTAPTEYM